MSEDVRGGLPSASSFYRIAKCPASWRAEKGIASEEAGECAERGTAIHEFLEGNGNVFLPQEEVEIALKCEVIRTNLRKTVLGNDAEIFAIEERMWLRDGLKPVLSGQADVILCKWNNGKRDYLIMDYKTGRVEPDIAEANWQLKVLAVLLYEYRGVKEYIGNVYCAIIQPSVTFTPQVVKYRVEDIIYAKEQILAILEQADSANAERIRGISQCKYCKAYNICQAESVINSLPTKTETLEELFESKTDEEKLKFCQLAKLAEKTAKSIIEVAKKYAGKVEGLTLKEGRKTKQFDSALGVKKLRNLAGDELILNNINLSYKDAEAIYLSMGYVHTKKQAQEDFARSFMDCTVVKQSDPYLVVSEH